MKVGDQWPPRSCKQRKALQLPLLPGAARLAQAIEGLDQARRRLRNAQKPISKLEQIRSAAVVQEAAELRAETIRLRAAHNEEIADWVNSGSEGDRPVAPDHLVIAEKRLGEIVAGMGDAKTQLAIAREGYAGAAERVQRAAAQREQSLWPAAIEAAGDVLREMERAVATVLSCEVGLRSLASALREAGNHSGAKDHGAHAAASKIVEQRQAARRRPTAAYDSRPGRSLLERLRSDAHATL
jgi:hypothetical protein